jgi:hypothetical protein
MSTKLAALFAGLLVLGTSGQALAQMEDNPECLGDQCGKPKEEGGGCGCGCGGSVWVAYTDDGTTLAYTDDADGDGKADTADNCPFVPNRDQLDSDADGVGDACDNCPTVSNKDQLDTDGDAKGDACDEDMDGDKVLNAQDNCPLVPNEAQKDTDGDGKGDACDDDKDNDGIKDGDDYCPLFADAANPKEHPSDPSLCDHDQDADGNVDSADNCALVPNVHQEDSDADGVGDACDSDKDNDVLPNTKDNCPLVANPDQADDDHDGLGNACDGEFCFVVDKANKDRCLNPKDVFAVSAGPELLVKAGQEVRLPLFANRANQPIDFSWTVTERPSGSSAAISNPQGKVAASRDYQYAYPDGAIPTFVADSTGTYRFQLSAKLLAPDPKYPGDKKYSEAIAAGLLTAHDGSGSTGSPSAGGCSVVWGAPLPGALIALLALRRRRK